MGSDAYKEALRVLGSGPLDVTLLVNMASWTQTDSAPGQQAWQRRLGITEGCFYWDGVSNGTTDTVMHIHLRATQPDDTEIHSRANVRRAWSSVKRRFPLLAAEVHEEGHDTRFIVREENVVSLCEDDVTFGTVSSFDAVDQFITDVLDGPKPLSSTQLARIYVLGRTDRREEFHVVLVIAHRITDGCSTSTILRAFFQTLVSSYDPSPLPIPTRLQMCLALESRLRSETLSLPKQRWRNAIGYALHAVRHARFKGGHTIPANFTTSTQRTPAKSRTQLFTVSRALSVEILSNCRRYGIPLTCASYALSQAVLSRMICRRYLLGEISEEEWEYRIREPMFFNGPLNVRPYLDQGWFQRGGSGEVGLNASSAQYILPFMPLGVMRSKKSVQDLKLVNGTPHVSQLMSFERFLHRCNIARAQVDKLFNHPWFVDICAAGYHFRLPLRQEAASAWRTGGEQACGDAKAGHCSSPIPVPSLGPIMTQDGSSLGNMDTMMPLDYPLPKSHPLSPLSQLAHPHRAGYETRHIPDEFMRECETPRLHIEYWRTHLRLRPAELYLGSWSVQGQLQFFVFYDEHVFDKKVVGEWLGEFREAIEWYLGEPRVGRRTQSAGAIPAAKL